MGLASLFNQIRRQRNKVGDRLVNLETKTHRTVKAKDWGEMMDEMARDSCVNLTLQEMCSSNDIGREGHWGSSDQ